MGFSSETLICNFTSFSQKPEDTHICKNFTHTLTHATLELQLCMCVRVRTCVCVCTCVCPNTGQRATGQLVPPYLESLDLHTKSDEIHINCKRNKHWHMHKNTQRYTDTHTHTTGGTIKYTRSVWSEHKVVVRAFLALQWGYNSPW